MDAGAACVSARMHMLWYSGQTRRSAPTVYVTKEDEFVLIRFIRENQWFHKNT